MTRTASSPVRTEGFRGAPPAWEAEMELVALCARPVPAPAHAAHLENLLDGPLDWDCVIENARIHGVLGMVYHHLAQHHADAVPADVMQAMARASRRMQVQNLRTLHELTRLAARFEASEIPLLTFKGPLLAQNYYGNVAFRRFGDIDVLVRRSDLERAQALLEADGYHTAHELSPAAVEQRHEAQLGVEFIHPERPVVIELHWALLNRTFSFRLGPDELWRRARHVPVGPAQVYSLAPEDLLLYLCAHGAKHHWSRLLCAADAAQVLRAHPDIDGEALFAKARRLGSRRILTLGLRLAERWLGPSLPPSVQAAMSADSVVDRLVPEIEDRWFGTEAGIRPSVNGKTLWFTLRTRERWRDNGAMLAHYLRLAVAPTEKDRALLSGGILGGSRVGQYLVRPIRLLGAGLSRVGKALRKGVTVVRGYFRGRSRLPRRVLRTGRMLHRRSWAERRDLFVALGTATLVATLLHACSFRRVLRLVDRWAEAGPGKRPLDTTDEQRLLWAVQAVSRRLLPRRPCLTQALTARLLLGRRGARPTELQLGVARDEEGTFGAHAWLERDGTVLTGGRASPHIYTPLTKREASPDAPTDVQK